MNMKKKTFIGVCSMLLLSWSCKQAEVMPSVETPESPAEVQLVSSPVDLELGAEVSPIVEEVEFDAESEEGRNLTYTVQPSGNNKFKSRLETLDEKPIHSLCVIAPKTGATAANTYYVHLTWQKKKGENYFFVKEKTLQERTGKTINFDTTKSWQVCGILTYNKNNLLATEVKFNPNATAGQALTPQSDKVIKDIPLYFDWVDIEVNKVGGWRINPKNTTPAKIKVKPLGVMVRVSLTNNAAFKMRVKELRVLSNGLVSGAGKLGWKPNAVGDAKTTPQTHRITSAYTSDTESARENTYSLTGNIDIEAGRTYAKSFLLWAFPKDLRPKTNPNEKKYTKVMVKAVRLDGTTEKAYPKMNHLYGFWSKTNNLQPGKRHHLPVTLYRPKLPLEYMTGYVAPTGNGFVEGNARWFLTNEYEAFSRAGYRKLTVEDIRGIIGLYDDVKFSGSNLVDKDMEENFHIGGRTLPGTYKAYYKSGNPTSSLRFDDAPTGGKRLYYSLSQYKRESTYGVLSALYLGPNYKGTFDETITPKFIADHDSDIVKKRYDQAISYVVTYGLNDDNAPLAAGVILSYMKPATNLNYSIWRVDPKNVDKLSEVYNADVVYKRYRGSRNNPKWRKAPAVMMHTHDNFVDNPLY